MLNHRPPQEPIHPAAKPPASTETPPGSSRSSVAPSRLFGPEFLTLIATATMYAIGTGAQLALLAPYVVDDLGGTEATAGFVMGSSAITALISRVWFGRIASRHGARRLIGLGAAVTAVSMVLLAVLPTVAGAIFSRLVMGAGSAAFFVGTTIRTIDLAPGDRRSQAVAFNLIAFHVGMGVGPFAGEWIVDIGSYMAAWWAIGAVSAAAAAMSWALSYRPGEPDDDPAPAIHRNAIWPGIVSLFGVFGFNGYLMFAALYAAEVGLANVGPVFMVSSATMIAARVMFGRLPDRIGPLRAGTGALVLTILATALVAIWSTPAGLFVGAALLALGLSMQSPSFMVIAVDGVSERERGSAMATYTAFFDIANALVGPVLGIIVAGSGYRAAFLFCAAAAGVALVLLRVVVAPRWRATTAPGSAPVRGA